MPTPKTRAVTLIAQRLPKGLVHPGDGNKQPPKVIPLPGLSSAGIPPEMAKHFAAEAGLPANDAPLIIAEAIVHLLENDAGLELIDRTELAQLRAAVAAPAEINPAAPTVDVTCQHRGDVLMSIPTSRLKAPVDCDLLAKRIDELHR